MADSIRILHIGDTHWSTEPIAPGIEPRSRFDTFCNWIASLSDPIDMIIHTGDWVHRGQLQGDSGASTRAAWERISKLGIPIFTAVGNHDNREALIECLQSTVCFKNPAQSNWKVQPLDAHPQRLDYWFTWNRIPESHESFLVLDARGPQDIDPRGELSEDQLDSIEQLLSDPSGKWTIFLHYPPIQLDCDWIDRTMLIRNGPQLHAILSEHSKRIRGVFFGHIHRPICCLSDGVLYASTGSATMHFPNLPGDTKALMQSDPIAFANYICISPQGALVKTQWTML